MEPHWEIIKTNERLFREFPSEIGKWASSERNAGYFSSSVNTRSGRASGITLFGRIFLASEDEF